MADRLQVPPETTEGWRPRSSGGERILVGLAALALVVAGLIVAGNLLRKDEVVSVASHSPQPTERPSRTPSPTLAPIPTPAPLELVFESATPLVVEPSPALFSGWIRARVELQILGEPQSDAAPIGVLAARELSYASEDPAYLGTEGWIQVWRASDQYGWIATRARGVELVDRYPQTASAASGSVALLAAGPHGFAGFGSQPGTSAYFAPYMLINSADGARWQEASAPPAPALGVGGAAVWGPAGWLLEFYGPDNNAWLSSSQDASHWTTLGTLGAPNGDPYPQILAASDAGYLFAGSGDAAHLAAPVWFSADGVNWREVHPGLSAAEYLIGGTTGGFYASAPVGYAPEAAFSVDGINWSRVAGGPVALSFPPVAVGERWFAIETYGATPTPLATPRPWLGRVSGGGLSWQLMPGAASFSGALVTALVSTGDEAIAFGWDRTTGAALTWTTTGSGWIRSALPVAFGGAPQDAAASSAGVVVVGHRLSALGFDPVIWHRARDGSWQPEANPFIARIPEPSLAQCAPMPRDALAFFMLDRATAPLCYGDAPITFRAWSTQCGYCGGADYGGGTYEPEWLALALENRLFLSPTESAMGQIGAVLPPTLATAPAADWLGTWLQVTGHFEDPAAATCRYTPSPEELLYPNYYELPQWTVNACRRQFVVTAVRVVSGP